MTESPSPSPSQNPLLDQDALPRYDAVRPEHVEPAIRALLAQLDAQVERLERDLEPTWPGLLEPLERIIERLGYSWSVVGHLMGVRNSDELRAAHDAVQADVVGFWMKLGQSQAIYDGLRALRSGAVWSSLDPAQQRAVELLMREAELGGVGLAGAERERFNEVVTELAELGTRFSNHVLDATKAFALTLRDPQEVDGLPQSLLELAAQSAREAGEPEASALHGPWRITLDQPSFLPFMQHARRRDLRERLYRAHITRASSGEEDNAPLIGRILELRREMAALLGYASYAELSLASKMAPDVDSVRRLLEELRAASFDAASADLEDLRALARERGAAEADDLCRWDLAFWSERLREARFAYTDEELRPYFPMPRVLDGLFGLAERLFGVRIVASDGDAPVWQPDVRFFRVIDADGRPRAAFFLDPYSRPAEKQGGAWMDVCVGRSTLFPERLPVAHLVCNGSPPVEGKPSLMSFDEVETLFHEFGHGLQHMLTAVHYGFVAGISRVEWDAVELPSQFMENWCYQRETLRGTSGHSQSGEPLPDDLYEKIRAARTYQSGTQTLRQLFFAFTDLELHHGFDPSGAETAFDVQAGVAERTTVLPLLAEDRFLCSFGHIFAGGYAAGYYSYKWAEVLSADAFGAFEEAGLDDAAALAATGRRFRETVLALGGSRPAMEVFVAFRGREPSTEALLRHSGLLSA